MTYLRYREHSMADTMNADRISRLVDEIEKLDPESPYVARGRSMVARGLGWSFADKAIKELRRELKDLGAWWKV